MKSVDQRPTKIFNGLRGPLVLDPGHSPRLHAIADGRPAAGNRLGQIATGPSFDGRRPPSAGIQTIRHRPAS